MPANDGTIVDITRDGTDVSVIFDNGSVETFINTPMVFIYEKEADDAKPS